MHTARSEDPADYTVVVQDKVQQENAVIKQAFAILASRMPTLDAMHTPGAVREYLTLRNATHSDQYRERFCVMWLDNQNRVLATETMAEGTISQTSVYPREVVRAALRHNAAAVVLTHNHPSGSVQPSRADEHLTQTLKSALALVDVRVIDHIITSPNGNSLSMAEQGLI